MVSPFKYYNSLRPWKRFFNVFHENFFLNALWFYGLHKSFSLIPFNMRQSCTPIELHGITCSHEIQGVRRVFMTM